MIARLPLMSATKPGKAVLGFLTTFISRRNIDPVLLNELNGRNWDSVVASENKSAFASLLNLIQNSQLTALFFLTSIKKNVRRCEDSYHR